MRKTLGAALLCIAALTTAGCDRDAAANSQASGGGAGAVPNPAMSMPDQVAWSVFVQAVTPTAGKGTAFETWPSDGDTFNPNAQIIGSGTGRTAPGIDQRAPVIPSIRAGTLPGGPKQPTGHVVGVLGAEASVARPAAASSGQPPIPNPLPPGSAKGGCNASANPQTYEPACDPGTVEEVRRNVAAYNYIVGNQLNSRSGLIKAFNANMTIDFPVDSVEVKTNWLPVSLLPTYYPGIPQNSFYLATDMVNGQSQQFALIAMHVISKQVPNWTWATFEHQGNRGRCDFLGCTDNFGAQVAYVAPVDNQGQNQGTVYAACKPTPALQAMFSAAGINGVFANYCLKGSQTDFTTADGLAVRVGNSVTENGFVPQASCMTCHGEANITAQGKSTTSFGFVGGNGQVGPLDPAFYWSGGGGQPPYYNGQPGLTRTAISADFVWSIPFCAYDDVTNPNQPAASNCAGK